jgi:hypothetical protein
MSVLSQIAYFQNRRDEAPNQELARDLAETRDRAGIGEIAQNLWHQNPNVQSDCVKVLYELGYLKPELIADYVDDFLKLLQSRNNRLVWGSMLALSTIAELKAQEIYPHYEEIKAAMEKGSVITVDNGVKTLALIAARHEPYSQEIWPYLLQHLATCRPKDVPQHAEKILVAVKAGNKHEFIMVLEHRMADMTRPQAMRLKRVLKEVEKR